MLNAVVTAAYLETCTLIFDFEAPLKKPNCKLIQSIKIKLQYQCNYTESATLTPCNFLAVGARIVGGLPWLPFCSNYYLL